MQFYIADTFTDSLKKLSNPEQKQTKTTVFDLQINPSHPSLKLHRIDRAKDQNFWTIRVNDDLRCVLHKKEDTILVCYVDHHDKAYTWAQKRKIEVHPRTGAVQIVNIPEVEHIPEQEGIPPQNDKKKSKQLFVGVSAEQILQLGVPQDWIAQIVNSDEDSIFDYLEVLPAEAGEALLDLAFGKKKPIKKEIESILPNPFEHPDSQRRFKLVTNEKELEEALEATWSKWSVFLHPSQKKLVEKKYNGPVRVSGSAGTGKTVVAIHRAYHILKENEENKVLLATFSEILVSHLRQNFFRLAVTEPKLGERVEFQSLDLYAKKLSKRMFPEHKILNARELEEILEKLWIANPISLPKNLVFVEICQILIAWDLKKWEEYKTFLRMGRRSRLLEAQRKLIWEYYTLLRKELEERKSFPMDTLYFSIAENLERETQSVFDAVILDEAQDLTPAQLKFVSSLTKNKENLFFSGDLGQRIFQIPFSWKALGIEIKGRSYTLRINYRTSEEIRKTADKLLDKELSDFDGNREARDLTFSVFRGPKPEIVIFKNEEKEIDVNREWFQSILSRDITPGEILVLVRSNQEKDRAKKTLQSLGVPFTELETEGFHSQKITLTTMHLAKGLEFRTVLIMACDSNVLPSGERLTSATDESELEEIYATERHLLYVACTRARDFLRITGVKPGSEFLDDMK